MAFNFIEFGKEFSVRAVGFSRDGDRWGDGHNATERCLHDCCMQQRWEEIFFRRWKKVMTIRWDGDINGASTTLSQAEVAQR